LENVLDKKNKQFDENIENKIVKSLQESFKIDLFFVYCR